MPSKKKPVLKLRGALEDAGWHAREAAVAVEEGVVWPTADAARASARELARKAAESQARHGVDRLRWQIDRRLVWPLSDRLREQSDLVRTGVATAAVAVALAAGGAGAMLASGGEEAATATAGGITIGDAEGDSALTLDGVSPSFAVRGESGAAPVPAQSAPKDPIGSTAWTFAEAFVLYEIGHADDAAPVFERVATPALAEALAESPPRLPAHVKVPKARVLNLVAGEPKEKQVEVSVSMVRLQAVSELRLTLEQGKNGWRVSQVRG